MRDIAPQIADRGADLVVVGNGSTRQAKEFAEERDIDFPLYTDRELTAYAAAGLRRSIGSTFHLGFAAPLARALKGGFRQGKVQGDPWQQGGAFVFAPENRVLLRQISRAAGDHVDLQRLVDAVPV